MAVKLSSEAQLVFFNQIFGSTHPVVGQAKALLQSGVTFEVGLYEIQAHVGGKLLTSLKLTYGTTPLMKGQANSVVLGHNKALIEGWVEGVFKKQGSPAVYAAAVAPKALVSVVLTGVSALVGSVLPLIKVVNEAMGTTGTLKDAKAAVDKAKDGIASVIGSFSPADAATLAAALQAKGGQVTVGGVAPKPVFAPQQPVAYNAAKVDAVIDLKAAAALGQKVHGTSTGSVYYCIAMTEHVKVAARLTAGGSVSIRVEWTDNPKDDLKKLTEAGVIMKQGYGSIHFDAENVPMPRVVGAFLLGTGINWKQIVTNGAELVVA